MDIEQGKPLWLAKFIEIYQSLHTNNVALIEELYHQDVVFEDPLHRVEGLEQLRGYFDGLYTNLSFCRFIVTDCIYYGDEAAVYWNMSFKHNKLNGGKLIDVSGHTRLIGHGNKVIYHRDYLDVGAMLYEHIPLLGGVIKMIKNKASQ